MTPPGPREALLHKAVAYYAANGVGDTSLRTLAAAIGTSQRMLHYHFGSREDVLAAVMETVVLGEIARVDALLAATSDPFEAGRTFWDGIADAAQRFGPLFFELAVHAMHRRPYALAFGEVVVGRYLEAFTRAFETVTDEEHARRLALLSLGAGRGITFDMLLDGDRAAADAAVGELVTLVRAHLAMDPPGRPARPRRGASSPGRPPAPAGGHAR